MFKRETVQGVLGAVVVLLSMYRFIVLGVPEKPEDKLFYMGAVVKAALYIGVAIEAVIFVYYPETKKRKHPPRVSASFDPESLAQAATLVTLV